MEMEIDIVPTNSPNGVVHYRIVEIAQQILGQLDTVLLQYYHAHWPNDLQDFRPVTTTTTTTSQPLAHTSAENPAPPPCPLEMITQAYALVKLSFPEKQDWDILTAVILFFYSTVVLEYYALNDAEQRTEFVQKKFVSDDLRILVTQQDQIFQVVENTILNKSVLELRQVRVTNPAARQALHFQFMTVAARTATLRLLANKEIDYELLPESYFIHPNDPEGYLLTRTEDLPCVIFEKMAIHVEGFFCKYHNKDTQSIVFRITTSDEPWASHLRRMFHGLQPTGGPTFCL